MKEHKHELIKIAEYRYDGSENLDMAVYWCQVCGAIQKDIESDGRFVEHYKVYAPTGLTH